MDPLQLRNNVRLSFPIYSQTRTRYQSVLRRVPRPRDQRGSELHDVYGQH